MTTHRMTVICQSCGHDSPVASFYDLDERSAVNRLVAKATVLAQAPVSPVIQLHQTLNQDTLRVADINALLNTLLERKRRLEVEEQEVETEVLYDFLARTRREKETVQWSVSRD